ncbi:MAG: amidohydrolase family protein, partial [Rhodospirillales bacterium]|nr:amidohydrolase family protein [Rhodospirillales bacterium]
GRESWSWEGKVIGGRDGGTGDGRDNAVLLEQFFGKLGARTPAGSLPPSDPALLLEHMDFGNVYASVGFGATRKWSIDDPALNHEVHRVYNDWVMELNAYDPDRLMILPNLPVFDPGSVPGEIRRLAAMGCKAAEFVPFDGPEPLFHEVWEPTWQAFVETGMVLCSHIGGNIKTTIPPAERGERLAYFSCAPFSLARPIADITYSGVLQRYPGLKVLFAECRAGWIPFLIYWMDRQAVERPGLFKDSGLDMLPSEYLKRQALVTFEEDAIAAQMIQHEDDILRHILVWGCDYPHPQGTWPDPAPIFHQMFGPTTLELRHEIVYERTRQFFGIEGPPADQLVSPVDIADDGAGRAREHASFE